MIGANIARITLLGTLVGPGSIERYSIIISTERLARGLFIIRDFLIDP